MGKRIKRRSRNRETKKVSAGQSDVKVKQGRKQMLVEFDGRMFELQDLLRLMGDINNDRRLILLWAEDTVDELRKLRQEMLEVTESVEAGPSASLAQVVLNRLDHIMRDVQVKAEQPKEEQPDAEPASPD